MTNNAIRPHGGGFGGCCVDDRAVLDRGASPHGDHPVIATQDGARPHRGLRAKGDLTDHDRVGVDKGSGVDIWHPIA